ncbi:MAG TPA: PAS domain S-box protein, partial [Phycisphaerae bacterium]
MRRTNTILAFMALMIVASVAFMYLAGIWAVESSENARHKQQVIAALNNFLSTLKDAETGQRGYLLVDEDRYLAPYQTALAMMATRLEKIDALVESQDIDAADAAMLKQLAGDKLTELNRTIEVRRSQGIDAAIAIVRAGHGQETMEKIRTLVAKMIDVQAGRLRLVQEDADVAGRTRTVIFSCLVLVNLGFLAWASSRIAKEIQNRIAAANEAALQKNLLSVTLSSIGDAVIATDPGSAITFMNPTAERLTGWTAADAKGKTLAQVFNIVNEDSRQSVESPVAKALRLGTIVGLANHTLLLGKDGREWPIDDSAAPIRDESGAVIGVVMVFHDISDRRATETALRRSEHELADFFENASVGLHWAGPDGIILRANQTELDMLGYSREEYVGRHIADFHADQPAIEDILKRLNCGESLHEVPAKLRRKDGSIRDVLISSNVLFENGKFIHTRCFTHDITERLRAEQEREHFVALAENSPNFVGMCDLAGVPFYVNRQGLELVGLDSLDQARRTPVAEFFFPEDRPTIVDEFFPSIVAKGQGEIEIRFRHFKTGKPIWMIYSVITLRDPFGKPTALATVSRDITERKMNEEALRDSENRYRRLFEAARDGVLILDAQTRKITDVNPFLMRLLDSPRDYFVGRELWEMGLFPNKAAAEEAFQKLHGANSLRFEN